MKVGAESRNKTIGAGALFLLAVFLVWHSFFSGVGVPSPPPAPVQTGPAAKPNGTTPQQNRDRLRNTQPKGATIAVNPLDPRLRLDLLKASQDVDYAGNGRNIFLAQAEPPIPTPAPGFLHTTNPEPPPNPQPKGPPPTPSLPFKAFGMATGLGSPRVMLTEGDDVFVVKEGQVINGRYKIVKINPDSVVIEDEINNNTQKILITAS